LPTIRPNDALTPAEILVLRLIAAGNANKQIADQLSITEGKPSKAGSNAFFLKWAPMNRNTRRNDRL
jgi:FixJ family two-component response regulator